MKFMNQKELIHFPIIDTSDNNHLLEFSHFNSDAPAGLWKKENVISIDSIKINIFIEGSFSVFSDSTLHHPMRGDICVLPPKKMHYGQISAPTHINYYQLNVGTDSFKALPCGDDMIRRLISATSERGSFVRPSDLDAENAIRICQRIETAILEGEPYLAYALIAEIISELYKLYVSSPLLATASPSYYTSRIIKYIEENYSQNITLRLLSTELGASSSYIARIFKAETGMGIHEYLNRYRVFKSTAHLTDHSVAEVAYMCGFSDSSHFITVFKKHMGTTPTSYKKALK
jgi:AraC-like DNA-binding protein